MTVASFGAFAGLCVLLAVTPGPDTFLALRFSMGRRSAGIASGMGSSVGSIAWAGLVAVGLAALLEQSAELYRVVKIVGGLYLVYLGVSAFVRARRSRAKAVENDSSDAVTMHGHGLGQAFAAGLVSTMLNPKVGLFFLAIVPQFAPAHQATAGWTLILGATFAVIGGLYLTAMVLVASRVMGWLTRPAVTKWLERVSSGVLAALGIGTIVASVRE